MIRLFGLGPWLSSQYLVLRGNGDCLASPPSRLFYGGAKAKAPCPCASSQSVLS